MVPPLQRSILGFLTFPAILACYKNLFCINSNVVLSSGLEAPPDVLQGL